MQQIFYPTILFSKNIRQDEQDFYGCVAAIDARKYLEENVTV
jgi:hypothetical protein